MSTGEVVTVTANDVERIGSAFDVTARFAGAIVSFLVVAALLISYSQEIFSINISFLWIIPGSFAVGILISSILSIWPHNQYESKNTGSDRDKSI